MSEERKAALDIRVEAMRAAGDFDAADHYWIVGGDESRCWSSAAGGYVLASDPIYAGWLEGGRAATRIANAFELDQVLRVHGLTIGRSFTAAEALDALTRIDAGQVKAALGRDDLRSEALVAGDADKLRALVLRPQRQSGGEVLQIEGATKELTIEERLARLEG